MASAPRTNARTLAPAPRVRAGIAKRLATHAAELTTTTVAELEARHAWFAALDAEHRSWVGLVARDGIDGFVRWFADPDTAPPDGPRAWLNGASLGEASAPPELARRISLQQSVEIVRTIVDVVEEELDRLLPRPDRPIVAAALFHYSRDLAFVAAEVYAQAAESRGSWDARLEALVVDAVLRGDADDSVLSRASALGWRASSSVLVAIGRAAENDQVRAVERIREIGARHDVDVLGAVQGERLVVLFGGELTRDGGALTAATDSLIAEAVDEFGDGPVVLGPVVDRLGEARASTRAAISAYRAVLAWPAAPRPVHADDLLPERALAGDGHARRELGEVVYAQLAATPDLLETLGGFVDCGGSVEATARSLFVHANTVRYRLKRIQDLTGYSPLDPRDAYALHMALTLGRLRTG